MGVLEVSVVPVRWYDVAERIRRERLLPGRRSEPLSLSRRDRHRPRFHRLPPFLGRGPDSQSPARLLFLESTVIGGALGIALGNALRNAHKFHFVVISCSYLSVSRADSSSPPGYLAVSPRRCLSQSLLLLLHTLWRGGDLHIRSLT